MSERAELINYLAGYFDGEGCVYTKGATAISVQSGDLEILKLYSETFGNKLYKIGGLNRQLYRWEMCGTPAQNVLLEFLPYLRAKLPQALYAVLPEYSSFGGRACKLSNKELTLRAEVGKRIRAINNRVTVDRTA